MRLWVVSFIERQGEQANRGGTKSKVLLEIWLWIIGDAWWLYGFLVCMLSVADILTTLLGIVGKLHCSLCWWFLLVLVIGATYIQKVNAISVTKMHFLLKPPSSLHSSYSSPTIYLSSSFTSSQTRHTHISIFQYSYPHFHLLTFTLHHPHHHIRHHAPHLHFPFNRQTHFLQYPVNPLPSLPIPYTMHGHPNSLQSFH